MPQHVGPVRDRESGDPNLPLWVMCGRRLIDKSFFDVDAALVGCGHVSGLLMRRGWPLALMLCADQVPIQNMHSRLFPLLVVETPQREICCLDSKAITCLFRAPRGTTCKRMLATARGVRMC